MVFLIWICQLFIFVRIIDVNIVLLFSYWFCFWVWICFGVGRWFVVECIEFVEVQVQEFLFVFLFDLIGCKFFGFGWGWRGVGDFGNEIGSVLLGVSYYFCGFFVG